MADDDEEAIVARVLVTGATGFVGGRVATRLTGRGDEVVASVRTPSPVLAALGVTQIPGGFDAVDADLLADVDGIVHAAASADADLAAARTVNRDGARHLLQAASAAGLRRFVHVSTTSVYDLERAGDVEIHEGAPRVTESGTASPASSAAAPYAITKAEAEAEVEASDLTTVILRPPAVLGAGPTSTWGTRIPQRLRDGGNVPRSSGTTFGWVHVEDLVDAVVAALDSDTEVVANVVSGHTTVGTYLAAVAALLPGEVTVPDDDPDALTWRGTYATDRLGEVLGVAADRTFEAAMAEIATSWADGDPAP